MGYFLFSAKLWKNKGEESLFALYDFIEYLLSQPLSEVLILLVI